MARAPVSKTGGWGFESLHSCQIPRSGIRDQNCSLFMLFDPRNLLPDPSSLDALSDRR
jgi:hypothetical protein